MDQTTLHFDWPDYLIFSLTLVSSLLIGIYHAYKGAGSSTTNYLLGGKTMGIFPIAMSLASSTVSTNTMLGMPTDVYLTGSMMFWMPIVIAIAIPIKAFIILPLLQDLGILSINEYLEMRFHRLVRRLFAFLNLFGALFYLAMLTYGPSLALAQVTGVHVYVCATITFAVCTFYTTIGGMKAVVWSDTLQIFLMMGSVIALVIKGVIDVGIENIWERNMNTSRIEFFNTDISPTTHKTVWSMVIGGIMGWIVPNQGTFQRFLAVPTRRDGQMALFLNVIVVDIFMTLCCFTGLLAFAKYFDCDPLKAKIISKADQILPYFVMDTLGNIPGLPGLFIAGIFSASLSTLSTVLNGLALTILEDFVRPCYPKLTDVNSTRMSKAISFGMGLTAYGMVFLVSNVETILETGWSIGGAGGGMAVGVFTLGMLVPWTNSVGATVGMLVSYGLMITLGICTQAAKALGSFPNKQMKPRSIENCPNLNSSSTLYETSFFNVTSNATLVQEYLQGEEKNQEGFNILGISFMWYTLIGTVITIVVGALVSLITCPQDTSKLNPKLVFPCLRRWVGKDLEKVVYQETMEDREQTNKKLLSDAA